MFGLKRGMMFQGFNLPTQTPPYASPPVMSDQQEPMPMGAGLAPVVAAKPGFFDRGGMGVNLLGGVADAVSTAYGGSPVFGIAQNQQRQRQQQLQDQIAQREAEKQQWIERQIWEREHPAPAAPHYFETNDGSQGVIGPDGKPQIIYKDPTPKTTWQAVDNGDGTRQLIPFVNGQPVGAGGGAAPTAPVGTGLPQGFTVRKRGGGATQATSPFPQ